MAKSGAAGESMTMIDVSLLGRDYKVSCKPGEEAELRDAVAFLDRRMRDIRESGKSNSTERIAVMAALNIVHEFQRERAAASAALSTDLSPSLIDAPAARRRIASMRSAIEQVLAGQEKLL